MTDTSPCPTTDQLKNLLDVSLPESEQAAIQAHVDSCEACQRTLESLVAGSQSWEAAADHLRQTDQPADEKVLAEAMKRMKSDQFGEAPIANTPAANPLDILSPSDYPGSLGRLGQYEVTQIIGQGGMGVVLKAFDPNLHRVVAVKILAPHLAHNPQARRRFIREAQAIAAVSHEHVIAIHVIDDAAAEPRIIMQYVGGRSLQQKIDADGSLELKEILRIGMQTASGLAAAHAQGLVHRDVKPSNILLENGVQRVKLTDFGLARAVDDASLTQSGTIAGTPQYMAPEQANGDAVDYRADLFSLGSVMYAMCVGHSPFRASTTMGVLKRVCHDPPRPIQEINPDIPDWLCAIVMKLLEKNPQDRFPSAKIVAETLERWLAHVQHPIGVPKPGQIAPPPSTPKTAVEQMPATSAEPTSAVVNSLERDARTILFQPISGRLFLFFVLLGTAGSLILGNRSHVDLDQMLIISVMMGLFTGFFGLLVVSLGRFVWANTYWMLPWIEKPPAPKVSETSPGNQSVWLVPENAAITAGIIVLLLGGHLLVAAIVTIIVWRVATARMSAQRIATKSSEDAETPDDPPSGAPAAASGKGRIARFGDAIAKQLVNIFGTVFDPSSADRNRLLIAMGWCVVGGLDLVYVSFLKRSDSWMTVFSMLMGLFSLAVSQSVYSRENFGLVRGISFIGLLPFSPVAYARIPLSVLTLLWLESPGTHASFKAVRWRDSTLGQLIGYPLRFLGTICWLGTWAFACFAVVATVAALYVIPLSPATCHVNDITRIMLKERPTVQFHLRAYGSGPSEGLLPPTYAYARQNVELTGVNVNSPSALQLRLRTPRGINATPVTVLPSLRELTNEDVEQFFDATFNERYPEHAANLVQAINQLNTSGGIVPSAADSEYRSRRIFDRLRITERYLHRGGSAISTPPPGFIQLGDMLSPKLFHVEHDGTGSVFFCQTSSLLSEFGVFGAVLVWLLGSVLLIWRRHFRRTTGSTMPVAVPSASGA